MLNLNKRPFNWLPFNHGDLFDLTCEYTISILERLNKQYHIICEETKVLTQKLSEANISDLHKNLFSLVDSFLDNYSKLVKCAKLSLGENVGNTRSKQTIFNRFSYSPNVPLQTSIIHGLRNTQQHFEERLQDYQTQMDPFLQLSYNGSNTSWKITFGNGGYKHTGKITKHPESFDSENLSFQSYEQAQGNLVIQTISINDAWRDILEIFKLIEENMEYLISQNNICCPPPRNVGIVLLPD